MLLRVQFAKLEGLDVLGNAFSVAPGCRRSMTPGLVSSISHGSISNLPK